MSETSQTLDRGLALLHLLASGGRPGGLTVTEAARELGVGRSVVYRLVATLEKWDLAARTDDGRLRLGTGAGRLALSTRPLVRDAAVPVLRDLADTLGVTAHLTVADGPDGLALAVVEPQSSGLHVAYRVGTRHPLTAGAAGHAILTARRGGETSWSTSGGELQSGAHGVAAAVPGIPGVEASVGVIALGPLDEAAVGPVVLRAARAVGDALAGAGPGA